MKEGTRNLYCLGPEDTFTERAGKNVVKKGIIQPETEINLCPNIDSVFTEVIENNSLGIIPIENSNGGPVKETLKGLYEYGNDIRIIGEYNLPLKQSLFYAPEGEPIIYASKLNALKQCKHIVGNSKIMETPSTVAAIALAASEPQIAAIGPEWAGKQWIEEGRLIRVDKVQDDPRNTTRFVIIAPRSHEAPPRTGRDKTTIILTLANEAGSLNSCLNVLSDINLTQIRSFDPSGKPGETIKKEVQMLITLQGNEDDENIAEALVRLKAFAFNVMNLGSYPESELEIEDKTTLLIEELVASHKEEILENNGNGKNGYTIAAFTLIDEPNSLKKSIEPFTEAGINLAGINSLPTGVLDKHLFYLSFAANHPGEKAVLEKLKNQCVDFMVI